MPNWCSTNIKFEGNPENIKKLHDFISTDSYGILICKWEEVSIRDVAA